jgi:hypothetical protein
MARDRNAGAGRKPNGSTAAMANVNAKEEMQPTFTASPVYSSLSLLEPSLKSSHTDSANGKHKWRVGES